MAKHNKFKNIATEKPKVSRDFGDDPDAKRKEDIKSAEHRTKLLVHWIFRILIVGGVIFVLALFFFILPLSAMDLAYDNPLLPLQRWAVAFLSTAWTAGIALLTLVITDLMKKLFDILKKHVHPND